MQIVEYSKAYDQGYENAKRDIENKIKDWFHNIGPFVFPEDDDTLQSLIDFINKK